MDNRVSVWSIIFFSVSKCILIVAPNLSTYLLVFLKIVFFMLGMTVYLSNCNHAHDTVDDLGWI